jgi:hypothetical protein
MALSNETKNANFYAVEMLVNTFLSDIKQRGNFVVPFAEYLNQQEFDLTPFATSPTYTKIISAKLREIFAAPSFDQQKANQLLVEIMLLDEEEKKLYKDQPSEVSLLKQLENKGFVDANYQVCDSDLNAYIEHVFADKNIHHSLCLSITDGNLEPIKDEISKKMGNLEPLVIPICIRLNHWAFILRTQENEEITFKIWDPLPKPKEYVSPNQVEKNLKAIVDDLYRDQKDLVTQIKYEYAGEQYDSQTCGARIARQISIVAGVENSLTKVNSSNPAALMFAFAKECIGSDEKLKDKNISYVPVGANSALIHLEDIKDLDTKSAAEAAVTGAKNLQTVQDHNLAVALQEIYIENKDREIDPTRAFDLAKERLRGKSVKQLDETKREIQVKLGEWISKQPYSNKQSPLHHSKMVENSTEKEDEKPAALAL